MHELYQYPFPISENRIVWSIEAIATDYQGEFNRTFHNQCYIPGSLAVPPCYCFAINLFKNPVSISHYTELNLVIANNELERILYKRF
jgi:hypothetical protein